DTWRVTPRLTVTPGLRYDTYTSKILPGANATFLANYGFTNAKGLDGLHALQPRINFNWHPSFDNSLIIYGGYGVFQGGNPNVWISNSYTNTGSLLGTFSCTRVATPTTTAQTNCNNALTGIDGFNVAQFFKDQNTASAVAGTGNTNAIAPGFKMPSVWKASLGVQKNFDFGSLGDNYTFVAEYSVSKFLSAPFWQDLYQEKALSGTAPDGRPEYFGLVNGGIKKNRTDVVLTEAALGKARSLSLQMSKTYHSGWADGLSFDAAVTFSKATDINSGTSSVATSSYRQSTWSDPNHPGAATSNYQIDTIAKLTLGYEHKFFGDNRTSFRLYNQFRTGQRFSFVFSDAVTSSPATANAEANASTGAFGMNSLYSTSNVELLYVPKLDSSGNVTLTSDPLVKFKSQADADTFNAFIHNFGLTKYAGTIAPRNAFKSPDNFFSNLRIMQELPAINPNWGKLEAWMDITNLGNMINDHYGVLTQVGFPYNRFGASVLNCQAVAQTANGASGTCAVGTGNFYQYTPVTQSALNPDVSSVYQVKFGLRYKF
ncbi:MAG TPA: TonB-dependent receptor, partial [Asticcacaulis sp.]|nr:TonB-dependent receptor [Asticcacaulis sp.]